MSYELKPYYCYTDAKGNTEAVLTFKRDQLLYDVCNNAYIEGHIMQTDNVHQRHTVQDVGEEGNVDRVTRMLDLTIAQCKELLYPFTKDEISNHELDDKLKEQNIYGIVLSLPNEFSQTTLNLMERLIHEYIVCYTVADWLSITHPDKADNWRTKAEDMKYQIKASMNSRINRVRRRIPVFP